MNEDPEVFEKKIIPIEGDVGVVGLGLSDESRELMKDISVVFHSAASVRFDDALRRSIILNLRGTHEVIKFALTLKKIVSFVHVSTTYCYPERRFTGERVSEHFFGGLWENFIKGLIRN
jgi:fatty acyl-CoA reductase